MGKNSSVELVIKARDDASRALKAITDAGDAFNAMQSHMSENSAKVKAALNAIGEAVLSTQKNMSELGKASSNITKLEASLSGLATQESSANQLAANIRTLTDSLSALTSKQDALVNSQSRVKTALEATQLKLDAYEAKSKGVEKALKDLRTADSALAANWLTTDKSIARITEKLEGWRTKLAQLKAAQAAAGDNKGAGAITKLEGTISRNEAELTSLIAKLAQLDGELATSANELRRTEVVFNSWQNVISETATKLQVQKEAVKSFAQPIKDLGSDMKTVAGELKTATSDFDKLQNAIAKQRDVISALEGKLSSAGVSVTDLSGEMTRLTNASKKSEAELARLAVRAESLKKLSSAKVSAVTDFNLPKYSMGIDPRATSAEKSYEQLKSSVQQVLALQGQLDNGLGTSHTKEQLADLVVTLRGAATEFKAYRSTLDSLKSELNSLTELRKFAGEIEKQETSVLEAKAAYEQLKAELRSARSAYRSAGSDMAQYAAQYERALAAAAQGRSIYQAQQQTLNAMRQAFNGAGLSAEHMVASQVSLDNSIRRTGAAVQSLSHGMDLVGRAERTTTSNTRSLGSAMREGATGTGKLAAALERLSSNGRTTLSFLQRLRGQVLAVTAAYVGLYGVYNQMREVYNTEVAMSAAETKLTFVNDGDKKKAKEDLQFVKDVSNGLGTSLQYSVKNYSSFAAATKGTNLAGDRTKLMFYNLSKAGRALRISNDNMHGSFIALQQIINKEKVSAEELNQQLGERFPGATQRFAKAMEKYGIKSVKDLFDQMSKGNVGKDAVYLFTKLIGEETTAAAAEGADAVDAWVNRAKNAMTELQMQVAEGGFAKELALAMQELSEAAKTPEAKAAFRELGVLAGNIIRLFAQLVVHAREVGEALKFIAEAWLAWKALGIVTFIYTLNTQLVMVGARLLALVRGAGLLGAAFTAIRTAAAFAVAALAPILGTVITILAAVALAAYAIFNSEWLYNQSETVRNFVDYVSNRLSELKRHFKGIGAEITEAWSIVWATIEYAVDWSISRIKDKWQGAVNWLKDKRDQILNIGSGLSGQTFSLFGNKIEFAGDADADPIVARERERVAALKESDAAAEKSLKGKIARAAKEKQLAKEEAERQEKAEKEAQAARRKAADEKNKSRKTDGSSKFTLAESAAKGLNPGSDGDLNPLINGTGGKGTKSAENLANRLNDSMEKVRAKIAELAADTESESMDAIRQKVAAQYEKLIRDLEKAGRTADANQVRSLIEIETKAKQAELRQKTSEKAEKSMNDLLSQRKEILTALANARSKGDAKSKAYATQLNSMLNENEAQLRQSVANADALARKYGDVKLANEAALNTEKLRTLAFDEQMAQLQSDLDKQKERKDELLKQLEIVKEFGTVDGLPNSDQLTEGLKNANMEMAKLYDQMIALAKTSGDFKLAEKLAAAKAEATNMNNALITADQVNQTFASNATNALMDVGEGIGKIVSGSMSLSESFRSAGTVFRQFASDFLKQIAQMIMQAAILKAIQSSGFGGFLSGLTTLHGGGTVGSGSALRKSVNPMVFAGAMRYHTGGIAGLAPNEVPAVLEQGEEVLTERDPRHRRNLFGSQQSQGKPQDIKIVNTIDSGEFVSQGMSTRAGQQAVLNFIRANKTTVKNIIGTK